MHGSMIAAFALVGALGGVLRAADDSAKIDAAGNRLSYNDGKAEGKKSIAGSGEVIAFTLPEGDMRVVSLRIHGSRYGYPQPPKENFEITFIDGKTNAVVSTKSASYALFTRGPEKWVAVKFAEPIEVPQEFKVVLNFNAQQTKGVYVSYDTSTSGKYSQVGLPGSELRKTSFDGDWMIEAVLAQ